MKRLTALLLALLLLAGLCACSGAAHRQVGTRLFTDSCGRTVDIPVQIEKIVPSGSLAQMILLSACPDKLMSLSSALTRTQKKYFDEAYWALPVTGQFYGGGSTMNAEEIISAAPDIIIDMGERKESIAADMDMLQEKTGIPVIFIEASLSTMAEAYDALGQLTGETEQCALCAAYIRETLSNAAAVNDQLGSKTRVLYAQGEYGTEVLGAGSVHAEALDYAGAENVAVLGAAASQGGSEVSMEQLLLWDPEVILLSPDANYDEVFTDPVWAGLTAVKNGEVYEVPGEPYNWLDRPPSMQRALGVRWLGSLLYPTLFDYDMTEETMAFYRLFYHYELTQAEAEALLKKAMPADAQP